MKSIFERGSVNQRPGPIRGWACKVFLLLIAFASSLVPRLAAQQPVNDNFTNATVIAGFVGSALGITTGATAEPGEPNHWPTTLTGRSVWYSWVAPADGTVSIDTLGSAYDTILAVYTGSNVAALNLIANDDDSGFGLESQVIFFGVAGTTYNIAVDGYNYNDGLGPRNGPFRLNWASATNFVAAPTNEIQFAATNFTAAENAPGFAVIIVNYGGGAAGPVSIDYATADGTALVGTDYLRVTNTLTFQVGESNKSFTVPILDNAVQNSNKTVLLSLANPTGGAVLGALSNAVLTIQDDETLPVVSAAGVFNFSLPAYVVTENETFRAPFPGASINFPSRSPLGALVMVTRTGGASGRVLVDVGVGVAVGGVFPLTQTLAFDDQQMSATFVVDIPQVGAGIINLTLLNPRADPLEDPLTIIPTIGFPLSSIQILAVNTPTPASYSIERRTYRVDEYNPFDPFNFGLTNLLNFIDIDIINPSGLGGSVGIETRANVYGYLVQDGSDYPEAQNFIFPETPYTDGFAGITNFIDYIPFDITVNFPNGTTRRTIRLVVTNDATVEFNEDVQLRLHDPDNQHVLRNALANVTIMYDEQPAGQADREWNPEGVSFSQPPFNATPGANNTVSAVAVQADGRTVLVGDFTAVNSVSRFRVARMNVDGSLDLTFNPGSGADGFIEALVIYPPTLGTNGNKILIAGGFSAVNNVSRHGLARLNVNGSLDNSFFVGNGADGFVHTLTLQSDGKVLVSGDFTHWNDVAVPGLMRLNQDGSLDPSFNAGLAANNTIWSVAVRDTPQSIFVPRDAAGTQFEDVNVIETGSTAGTITITYDFYGIPDTIRVFYQGAMILDLTTNLAGSLTLAYGPGLATDFTIIMNQGIGLPGTAWEYKVSVLPVITARTIYLGGDFTEFNGLTRNGVVRLLDNGTVDPTFDPGLGVDGSVFAVAVQPDNKLLVGGAFHRFHTSERNSIVRLRNTGALDADYNVGTGFNDSVYCITLQPDNKALIGGLFQEFDGVRRMGLTRLFVGGSLDTSFMDTAYNQFSGLPRTFSFDPPRYVNSIALQADGNLMIGGSFTNLGGNYSIYRAIRNNYTVFTRADKTTRFNIARVLGGYTPGPGNTEFDPSAFPFTIDENGPIFYATMRRVDGRLGTAQVIATNSNVTANSPGDFFNQGVPQIWPEFAYAAPDSVGYVGVNYFAIPILEDTFQEGDETFHVGAVIPSGSITLGGEFVPLGAARGRFDASMVTIADNDFSPGEFNFNLSGYITNEGASFALITVIRTNGTAGGVSVDYLTRPGPVAAATTNADFSPVRGTLSFSSGQAVRTFQVPIVNDAVVEFDETITLVLTNATGGAKLPGGTPTSVATATLTIVDNDFLQGRLNFATSGFTNNENETVATIIVTRTGGNVGAMTVQVRTANGTATHPADYTGVTNTLSWADSDSSAKSFTIPLVLDGLVEGTETVNLFLYNPAINGALGARTNAVLGIADADNFGVLSLSQPFYEVDENGSAPVITVNRSGGIAGTATVNFATAVLTATPGVDYNNVSGTLTFLPGETSHNFVVPILDDLVPDGDKAILITLQNATNGSVGSLSNSVLTFIDNESFNLPAGSPDPSFHSVANDVVYALALQNDGRILMAGEFTLVNDVPRNRLARVKPSGVLDETFNIGPGANGSIRTLALQPDGKLLVGGLFTVINSTNRNHLARLGTDGSMDAFFNPGAGADNPVYALALQGDDKIVVGGSFATFNGFIRPGVVRLNTNGSVDLNFTPGTGVNGTVYALAVQSDGKILVGGDFTSFNGVARTNLIRLNLNGTLDNTFNPAFSINGVVSALLVQPDGKILLGGSFTNVNGTLRRGLARLLSGGGLDGSFLAGWSGADDAVFDLKQQVDGRLVVAGAFRTFNGVTRRGVTRLLADGATDPAINFGNGANAFVAALLIQPDRHIVFGGGFTEYDDQAHAHLVRIYGGSIAGSGALEFSAPLFTASESGSNAVITLRRRYGTFGEVRVEAFTQDGTAVAGTDYTGVTNTLIFPQGETRVQLVVPVTANAIPNDDRTVLLGLRNFLGADTGPQPVATLVIQDDDASLSFSGANYVVNENAVSGNATILLTRQGGTNQTLTVDVGTVAGGTATAGADYTPTTAPLSFGPGELSKLFTVPIANDTVLEGNETILLALSNPGAGVTLGLASAVLNVIDDELLNGQFLFQTNNFIGQEGEGVAQVVIVRTNGAVGIVSVRLTTSNLSALAGSDYVNTNILVTFDDGVTNKVVPIVLINNAVAEPDEAFLLTLSQPTGGATILQTNATVTIYDDEILPGFLGFQTNEFFVNETAGFATINVVRANSRRGVVSVDFSVSNGSATAGLDYTTNSGTLTFADGEDLKSFLIPIINDVEGEGNETVRLSLTNLQGTNTTLTLPTANLNIVDDDTALRFSSATYSAGETQGGTVITVLRGGIINTAATVDYLTVPGGTAAGGLDYTPVSGTLAWSAGDATPKTFLVPIIDNTSWQADRTVLLVLTNAVGLAVYVGTPSNAVLTIINDETQNPVAGPVDPTFNANFGAVGSVQSISYDSASRLYVGGDFSRFHGTAANRLVRLQTNGALDPTFNPGSGADQIVYSVTALTNGAYVAGAFTNVNGVPAGRVARLLANGSVDVTFLSTVGANGPVRAVALAAADQLVLGGEFLAYDGNPAARVARLNSNGTLDTSFIVGSGPNNTVRAVAVQPNGQVLIGGDFTSVSGFIVSHLARLNVDGSLDTTFDTGLGADGPVNALALQADGRILVGGEFVTINGVPRDRLARLNAGGSVDTSFIIGDGADDVVRAVALDLDGHVLVAGAFNTFNTHLLRGVARLNSDGSLDPAFNVGYGADAPVNALSVVNRALPPAVAVMNFNALIASNSTPYTTHTENFITFGSLVGGSFLAVSNGNLITGAELGSFSSPYEIRLAGGYSFTLQSITFSNLTAPVTITSSRGGTVAVVTSGPFFFDASFAGVSWVQLSAAGVAIVDDLVVLPGADAFASPSFALGGDFEKFNQIQRGGVVVLGSGGSATFDFDPRNIAARSVYASGIYTNSAQPGTLGKVVVGGDFTALVGVDRVNRLARLNIDGTLDSSFASGVGADGPVRALAIQPDGRTVFGGYFTTYDFLTRAYLARVNADGTLDNSFNFGAGLDNAVLALALQADGKVVVGGLFTTVYGVPRQSIARMNTNGTVDASFTVGAGADGAVRAVAVQADGKILIGGDFQTVNGLPRAHIARLNANGTVDGTFNPGLGADGPVNAIALTSTGGILIGGAFTNYHGAPAPRLVQLTSGGALDGSFNPGSGANDFVSSIVLQPNGLALVGGSFTTFNGQIRHRLVRLTTTGALDPTINFGAGANDLINTIALQNYDGKMVIGGRFTAVDGLTRVAVARLFGGTNAGGGAFQFSTLAYFVNEHGGSAVLTVHRTGGTLGAASVAFATGNGSATSPTDYTATIGTLNFAEAESVKQITVPIIDNSITNVDRTFIVTLSNPSPGSSLGSNTTASVIIQDNDSVIGFSAASYLVNENGLVARITVQRTGGAADAVAVEYATGTNGTATAGLDFTPAGGILVFPSGVRSQTFDVLITDDVFNEFHETVPLTLLNPAGPAVLGLAAATLTIVENDAGAGVITFGTNSYFASEEVGLAFVEVLRTNGHSGAVAVNFQTLTGSATPGIDFVVTNGSVSFGDGVTSAFLAVRLLDNVVQEGDETVPVRLFGPSGGATLGLNLANLTIVDNDAPGTFVFSSPLYTVSEAGAFVTVTILRTNGNQGAASVTLVTSGGTATPTADYAPVSNVLNFASGQSVGTVNIAILQDGLVEGTETVGLLLANAVGATNSLGTATIQIHDDEVAVGFSAATYDVTESTTNVTITLLRTGDTNSPFSALVNTSDGTAFAPGDYLGNSVLMSFAAGQTSRTFIVTVIDDTLAEGDEFVNLTLSNPSPGLSLGPVATARLNILDNDTVVQFSAPLYATNEATVVMLIPVIRSGFLGGTSLVDCAVAPGGTATAGVDFFGANTPLTFAVGQALQLFQVTLLDDFLVEGDETIFVSLSNPLGTLIGAQSSSVINIVDNDTTVGFSQTNYVVNEKVTNALITIVRNGSPFQAISVQFRTINGSASNGLDYVFTSNNLSWAANDISPRLVAVPVLDDALAEGSEYVQLQLVNPTNALADPLTGLATLTIVDDAGAIAFAATSFSVIEGATNALIQLVRTGGSNGTVSVAWTVTGGTATAGSDYTGTTGTVVFAAGETTKQIILPIAEDALVEGIENVILALSNASNGARVGGPSSATLSILDNDTGIIVASGTALTFESLVPTNRVIEPNERVTIQFGLRNAGLVDANNVSATIVYANGITHTNAQTQSYGALLASGHTVARPFNFTALGTNGTRITATLLLTNNGVFLGPVSFDFVLGSQSLNFQNANAIALNVLGSATPYPAGITVAGLAGPVNRVTVALHNITHPFPDDLDILLVAPNGARVMLMSDAGGGNALNNVTLTFDDAAALAIPDNTAISAGTYRPGNYLIQNDPFAAPAPAAPYSNTLAAFNGSAANGVWSLYITDDSEFSLGAIANGWSLNISTADTVVSGADLAVVVTDAPDPATTGGPVTYTIAITNYGPATATSVVLTNLLPSAASLPIVSGPGTHTLNGNVLSSVLGSLALGSGTVVTVTMTAPATNALLTFDSTVASSEVDPNPGNNHVSIKTTVGAAPDVPPLFVARKNSQLVLSWQDASTNVVLRTAATIGVAADWSGVPNAPVISNGVSTVTMPMDSGLKFFRLQRVP